MKRYEFNYSKDFKCIADKCKHNCCIGWEIAVNKASTKKYELLKVNDARFENCVLNGAFNMQSNGRCPFLDNDNLCHVIKNYGEKALCRTCKTHPRFINFWSGMTETGLGLYCEEAGRIVLSSKQKMKLSLVKKDNKKPTLSPFEKKAIAFRNKVVKIIQDRKLTVLERISSLKPLYDIDLNKKSFDEWLNLFKSLEKLKTNDFSFDKITAVNFLEPDESFALNYEQLLSYLAFRHLSRAIDQLDLRVRLAFVVLSFNMINAIFLKGDKTFSNFVESVRFYSSEIETSDDNIYKILDQIESLVSFL